MDTTSGDKTQKGNEMRYEMKDTGIQAQIIRKEWSEMDVLKKILFEDRKIVALLERMLVIFEKHDKDFENES